MHAEILVFCISYYFRNKLKGKQFYDRVMKVLKGIDELGFTICHIVTDNYKVNTTMFKQLCNGERNYEINHKLKIKMFFFSYDYYHIKEYKKSISIKKKCFVIDVEEISSQYLHELHEINSKEIIKPVRHPPKKYLHPSELKTN